MSDKLEKMEGSGRHLIEENLGTFLERLRKTTKNSVRIAGAPIEFRIEHLQNTNKKPCRRTSLLGLCTVN
jgi:hypothetical protein